MAAITQIKLSSTGTTYNIYDYRIGTSTISTCSYVLGMTSTSGNINPISTSNLASVLGVPNSAVYSTAVTLDSLPTGVYHVYRDAVDGSEFPTEGIAVIEVASSTAKIALLISSHNVLYTNVKWNAWKGWKEIS
mgnify:CR=1 FL=1